MSLSKPQVKLSNIYGKLFQGSQSRVGKSSTFLIFPQITINFSYFSSKVAHFLPHFCRPPGKALATPLSCCDNSLVGCENRLLSNLGHHYARKKQSIMITLPSNVFPW